MKLKKTIAILSMAVLSLAALTARAAEGYVLDPQTAEKVGSQSGSNFLLDEMTQTPIHILFSQADSEKYKPQYSLASHDVRLNIGNTMTFSLTNGQKISKIVFDMVHDKTVPETTTCDSGEFSFAEAAQWIVTWENPEGVESVTFQAPERTFFMMNATVYPAEESGEEPGGSAGGESGALNEYVLDPPTSDMQGTQSGTNYLLESMTQTPIFILFEQADSERYKPQYSLAQKDVRLNVGNKMTFSLTNGEVITKIVFDMVPDKTVPETTTCDSGEFSFAEAAQWIVTWENPEGVESVTFQAPERTFFMMNATVYGKAAGSGDEPVEPAQETVATPVIAPEAATFRGTLEVSITCATEEATIYYTLDGTVPTAESTLYAAPFEISESVTVKAIAVKEGWIDSAVAEKEYEKEVVYEAATLPDFLVMSMLNPTEVVTYTGSATVSYQNGPDLYLQDAAGAALVYGRIDRSYERGAVISGFGGMVSEVGGNAVILPEADTFAASEGTAEIVPSLIATTADLTASLLFHVVKIEKGTFAGVSGNPATTDLKLADGTAITLSNRFAGYNYDPRFAFPTAEGTYDVEGMVVYVGDALTVAPYSMTVATGIGELDADQTEGEMYTLSGMRAGKGTMMPGIYVRKRAEGKVEKFIVK